MRKFHRNYWLIFVEITPLFHKFYPYQRHVTVYEDVDTNDCSDGTVVGGLLGGGLAGFGSRGKDRWWAIPTGIVGGAMLGCDYFVNHIDEIGRAHV